MKKSNLLITTLTLAQALYCFCQPGSLDLDFDADGVVTTEIGTHDYCWAVAVQADGQIIAVGNSDGDVAAIRYNTDGTPDNTFGGDGIVTIPVGEGGNEGRSVEIQPDGKIVIAGYTSSTSGYDFFLLRLNTDGTLDNTFSVDGKVITDPGDFYDYAYAMILQPDGKIVLTGESGGDFAVLRYNTNGTLDNTFGENGIVLTEIGSLRDYGKSLIVQPDNKIVVAGASYNESSNFDIAVVRYNADGTLDNTFGDNGKVITILGDEEDIGRSVTLQPDNKILVAGYTLVTSYDFVLLRYNSDGTLDNSFHVDGIVKMDFSDSEDHASSVIVQPDGKILVAGSAWNGIDMDFALIRYNTDGTLDLSFGNEGTVTTDFDNISHYGTSVALQADGKIVFAGYSFPYFDFTVARYISGLSVGILNFSEKSNTLLIYPNPIWSEATLRYELLEEESVSIGLYNLQGKLIETFLLQERRMAGPHEETIHISKKIPGGCYLLVISNGSGKQGIRINIQ